MNIYESILVWTTLAIVVLLLLGTLKWIIGFCIPGVSQWGLNILLDGTKIEESDISSIDSDRDEKRPQTIRICSRKLEFILNLTFFLTFPLAVCCNLFNQSINKVQDESHIRLIGGNSNSAKTIPISTYGDKNDSKPENEDTNTQ
ncbi:uncharacterized protein LOC130676259 [Microplitis mediator]|uniref:uncharacterized protein LOC130676259 n=1 Tax=Microplitis mediator TaxID=375433 RepID=UPI0025569708|nr:uncharacterized protein LOC130676259 [Microplitis mediator]